MVRRPLSPEVQSFGREVRLLLRHPLVGECRNLRLFTASYMRRCMQTVRRPAFIQRNILQLVRSTQRLVDRGISPPQTFHDRYVDLIIHALSLMTGYFCGRVPPIERNAECAICLFQRGGNWWFSPRCGHCFHTNCIAAHLRNDDRCPLCRVEF